MPNPLDTLYDQLKGQYPDLVDRSEFIGKLSNEDELKKLHDAASKDIPGFVDFDNFKSKVGESLSTYDQDSDYKAQSAPAEQESAPTDITIPRREKGRHVPSEPQNGGISSEAYVPTEPGQPIDTRVDTEAFDRETGDLDELDRRYQEKVKRLEGYGREPNLYANEDEARKHYEAYSKLYDEAEQDRLVYNRRVKAADDERAEQQRQLDLQSKDRKTRRSAEYGGYTNDQVRKEQERLKKERAYLEDPKSKRKADYSRRVMEYNADQTALSGEADKRNKRAESKRAMYDEVKKVAEDPDVQKRITGNDIVAYVLSGNNPSALQNINLASKRAKTMSIEELADTCKNIAGQKYARGDNKDIYAPLAAAFMAYHNELMYRLGGDEPKSALEMRYDMIDKATESSPEGDNFMLTLRNYLDGTAGMGTANFENDQSERANIPQFAIADIYNDLVFEKDQENMRKVEQRSRYPLNEGGELDIAAAATDINYDEMLQQAYDKFGEEKLRAYIVAHALHNGISIDESARRVNQSIWNATIGKEMEEYRPKSNFEFFVRRIFSDNTFSKLTRLGIRGRNGNMGGTDPFALNTMVLDEYAKEHPGWDTAAVVTNFAVLENPFFSVYSKAASGLVGVTERAIIGAATKTAEKTAIESTVRALNQSFWYRLAKGGATGALVGFQYGTMSGAIDQAYYDGNVDFGKVIANGGHMARDFAIMHGVGELFGVTGDAILRRGQRAFRNGQGKFLNRLETTSLHFLNNVAKTTANASIVTGLYAAIDKPALERENKKIEAENKKIEAENARLPEDKQKPLKPLNQIASVEDTFYSSLRMFAGLDAVGMLRSAWSIGVRGQYERNKHVKVHFDKFDREALEKAFGKNPNSLLRQIVFGNVDGVPAKWFEIDPEAEQEIYKELGRELTPAEKEAYATYGLTELRKVILNKDIPWATRAKIVSVVTGRIVQEPPVARGTIEFVMDKSGTVAKRIIVRSLDMEGNVIQAREFDGQREFEAARSLYESLNDRGWRNNALLCGNLVIDAIEDKTYADTVDEMAREKGIAPDQFEQMVFGIKQKDVTGEKVTYQERQLVDEFDKRHQQKQQAETELAGPNKLFEQIAREVFGAEWKRALNIPSKSWGEMSEAEKEFVNRYIERIGAMGVAERNKLMNANPDWSRAAKEYEESVRRRMAEAERPAEAEPLPNLEDEKVSVEVPAEERVEPVPEVIELEEEKPVQEPPVQEQDDADAYEDAINKLADEIIHNPKDVAVFRGRKDIADSHFSPRVESLKKQNPNALKDLYARINEILFDLLDKAQREQLIGGLKEVMNQEEYDALFAEEKPDTEGQPQAGTIGFEPVEQPTERERFDAERKEKAATITDADIEANREALGIPEGTALTDETRQIYAEDLAEDLMRYERFKRGESDEKARFHDYWESKFNPKRPKLEKPVEKQEEPVEEEELEEEEVTDADALIEQFDNLKGRSDLEKYRHALKVFAGDDEIMDILEDLEPHDITEWVSSFLGLDSGKGYSMLWESKTRGGTVIAIGFKEETGWSWNDVKGFAFMFDNKNGMSPRRVAEKIWEALPSGMKNQYSDVDVFNIMMDLFKSSSRKSDLTNYIRNNRMEQVRELLNRRRSEELADIARYKERMSRGEEEPVTEPVTTDDSDNEFAVREDEVAPFSLLSLNYRQGEVEGGTVRSRARTRKQIGTIAKALGYKIRWVADKSYNAKIDTNEKVLYLNIRTDQPLAAVMGHEVTHDLRKSDPKAYEALKRYAQDLLGQEQWDNEVKDVTDVYNEEYKRRGWEPIRADKAEEEVVCDTMGKLLHSRKGLRELAGSLDPGVAGKVYRLMKDITDKIKSALGKEHNYDTMDSALSEFLKSVEQRAKKNMPIQDAPVEDAPDDFSLRRKPAPKNTGVGYKVFFLKDGKLYPPMVANIGGEATPFGVWLDADAAPIAGKSKTGRNKVKAGGKGTQGGSGTLAYRPGWHLGKIPYALQFNRGKKVPNPLGILNKKGQVIEVGEFFPNDFVWAEVEYAADKDYQEEAHGYGVNANGKYNPSLAGLPRVPEDGSYEYRTNPNPATDPWIITGAMKVNKILKPSEVDEMVRAAGREPQKRQEGAFTDEQIDALNKQLSSQANDVQQGIHRDPSGGYSVTDKADIESLAPRMEGESEAAYAERVGEIEADEKAFVEGDGQFSLKKEDSMRDNSVKYFEEYHVRGNKDRKYGPLRRNSITRQALDKANEMIAEMRDYIAPWYDRVAGGNRYLPEEVYGLSTIFDNASYGATLENTLICTRTLAYNDFCDSVKRKLGRPLTKRESFLASQMLYDIATDPQCLYCYVSLDRKAYDEYLLRYFDERDAVIERYNKMGDKSAENIDALYKTFLDGRKDTYQMRSRFNSWLMLADHDSAIGRDKVALSSDRKNALAQESNEEAAVRWRDITKQYNRLRGEEKKRFKQSKQYLDALHAYLATEQGQIKDACAYAQGASWAKKEAEYRSYTGELLRTTKRMLGGLASHYGLRFYSFSEYSPAFILENMQMIRDAALRGLKGFAYTKEIDFCKIFLPTGININCSTYGRRNAAGEIVMDERQGANWDEARALRDQYENMGIVFVATDDEMVRWAKEQPWIDVIIPFHIVRTGADIAEFYGWTNYTNVSADYDAQGRHKDIMPPEHNNSIEDYDRLIAERGLTRRFPQFYDGPGDQNYMKLINETRRKASDTPILTPVFNMEEAKKSFDKFVEKGGYWGGFYEVGADDVVRAVDEVAADIEAGKSAGEVEYGRQDIDFDSAMANLEKTRRRINRNREHGNVPKTSFSLKARRMEEDKPSDHRARRERPYDLYRSDSPAAELMVSLLKPNKGDRILEPSAGKGDIIDFVGEDNPVTAVEINPLLIPALKEKVGNGEIINEDFLNHDGERKYPRIVMNPPFGDGGELAIQHTEAAFGHLEDGGRLVAIIPSGKEATALFNEMMGRIEQQGAHLAMRIDMPSSLFNKQNARLKTSVVVIDRNGESSEPIIEDLSSIKDKDELYNRFDDISRQYGSGLNLDNGQFSLKRDDRNAPTFYSNAARAVENVKQNKATAEQWKAMLTKQGGIKAGEDKWMGLSQWLDEHKGETLTKDEVAQFVADNGIQMEETYYGEKTGPIELFDSPNSTNEMLVDGHPEYKVTIDGWSHECTITKNGDVIGTVAVETSSDADKVRNIIAADLGVTMPDKDIRLIDQTRLDYTTPGLENKREIAFVVPDIEPYQEHDEIHFGPENQGRAIMWVRFGETTDTEGNRVLVIDEIQSNRHQDAREKGYRSNEDYKNVQSFRAKLSKEHPEGWSVDNESARKSGLYILSKEEHEELMRLNSKAYGGENRDGIPAAPFEKNWHEVAMKRMLRLAAEEGFDKVAWTTGGQQARRYDLGQSVKSIERTSVKNDKGAVRYNMYDHEGWGRGVFVKDGIVTDSYYDFLKDKPLTEVVGKEIAEKMMAMNDGESIQGDDLMVGGKGMKSFYDGMLPQFMNKYGKRWGVKVGEVTLNTPGRETMHSVDVNEDMKRSVMQGQPLFSLKRDKGNLDERQEREVKTKNFKRWFGDWENDPENASKVVDEEGRPLVMYHTTTNEFTVFDKNRIDTSGHGKYIGYGFNFASHQTKYGPNVMKVYLDAKHPLRMDTRTLSEEQVVDILKGLGYRFARPSKTKSYDEQLREFVHNELRYYGGSDTEIYQWISNFSFDAKDVIDAFKDLGFDSSINYGFDGKISTVVVFDPTQIKSATENNGEFSRENPDIRYSLMGRRGAGRLDEADNGGRMERNAIAEEMEKEGKDARTIKLATGWERGADDKWRYEEPDGDFVGGGINVAKAEQGRLKLSDVWDSPELFKAYPEFADIPIEIVNNPLGASATTQVDRAYETSAFETSEKFIREYDKWLEDEERRRDDYEARLFSYEPGEEMYDMLSDIIEKINNDIADAPNRLARSKEIVADPNKIVFMKVYLNKAHLSKDGVISADAEFSGNNARQVVAHEIQHLIQEHEGFASGGSTGDMTYGQYRRLAGETEARNVSRRVDMPEYERRRSLASDTEDVPRERQTVRYTSKTSESNSSEVYTDLDGNEVYRETREDGTIEREITTMPDGSKRAEWFDKEGRIVKEQLDYYPNGEVRRVRNFDWNGLTREVEYDENRRITSYYLPAIGTDWSLDENGVISGKSNGVEIKPYNFQFSLKTYHGSGADFDRFNHDYVGSGEGNQAYGWGTYVTEVEGIGRRYAMIDYRRDGSRNHFLYSVEIPDEKEGKYLPYGERVSDPKVRKVLTDRLQQMADEYWNGEIPSYKLTELDKALNTFMPRDIASVLECSDKEVSQLLSKAGYTGVKYVANVFNRGQKGLSYNYVIFNEKDLGITDKEQFSLKREDAEYQKAAESKYMWRSAARMLKKAAKAAMPDTKIVDENGDPLVVWHGSDTEFFIFDRDKIGTHSDEGYTGKGFYFAPRFEHADHYNRAKDGVTRKFYLNVTNPLIVTGQNANDSLIFGCDTLEEAKKKIWKYRAFFDGREAGAQKYIDELTQEKLDEINSHDGVWRQGTMDNGYYDEIVVKDSKQVKSADVALYDDNGNFIPLSERFNLENEDVRYSLKRRRNRDDYTDEDRADAAIIANTYLAQADALRQQIEADREQEQRLVEERNKLLAFDYPAADPADRPAIMDRINALRNQINDLRNANYENNTKLRSMDYEYRVAKEILEQGAVTDEEAARFDAGQMTREEKVLESLFKAAADSRADKKAKQKAIRGLVRELTAITDNFKAAMKARGIESQRKHYDKGTVDHIIRLAKAMMGTGYIDNMTSYEVKRLMGMINNAATRESIEEQAGRIVDMMLDHQIRTLRNDFDKQLRVTGQKTNSSGVQVQAGLDQEGQVVMEAMRKSMQIIADSAGERYDSNGNITEWGEFYEKTLNDMGDADPVKAEQARKIFEGVWLASKWYEDVRTMEINGRILRSQMEDFKASNKPAKDADADTKQRYNDVLADYQEMLRQNKIKIIEAYERMTGDVGLTQAESVRRAKEFADAQKQRVNEIQHNANSDLADVDDNTQVETPESRVFGANKNNVLARLLFASAGTYEKFMRFFGRMAPNGEGYLFKRFMTQYHHARQDYWKGRHSAFEEMDKKMAEVFGKKKMHWSDIYEMTRDHKKFPPITVSYWDGYRNGQPYLRVDELNQSEALYLYMINKMPDGRMKLRHMGITDDVVQQMAGQINNKLIQLADWLQSEFLPKMRIKYNETHKRVFGADMAAIEDYFPLRINKLAVASDMDITERDMNDNKPSTITGAIVKRRVNTLPIDLHTDAFDVALSHIDEMEHWSAFAEFNRDNNTLVNYKRFRTKVNNMRSLELGAGNVLWKNFTDAVAIAADAYHPRAGSRSGDHYSTRVAKFVSTAKIALRPYTALKQLLSIPAFWADSDPLEQMKATLNVADTWQWAIENLPGFAERWQSRQAGNIKLANYNDLSGLRRRKTMRKLQRAGMWANAAIDGLACAMGGKAVYETKLKRYRKMGYDEARAQEKALIDAAIAYNNSQQSSEGAYVSPLQVDRTWFANAFSVFRSASMGYTRRLNTSLRQLRNATFKPGYGAQSVEFLKKQMMRDGLTEEQATKWAHRIYRRANLKASASVAIFGQILPFAWNLGANMFYLLFGNDDKEKEGILADSFRHSFFGPVEGLTGGNVISELGDIAADTAIGNIWGDGIWGDSEAYKTLGYRDFSTMPLSSDLRNLLKYFARDEVKAANEVVNILFQVATGVNPQTITDWATAILDFSRSDMERRDIAMFAMRLLSTPQQQLDKFYLDQMNLSQEQASKMSVDDLIKRYATYKRWRETPLTGWMYSDEREKKVEEKFQKRYEEMLEERSVAEEGLRGTINDMKDLPRKRTMMQKLQKELTDSIEAADPDLYKKALEGEKADDDEYVRHVTDKDVEQMAELQMKKKALRAARDRKVKADKDAEAGRITQEEYDAIYEVCAHEWKLYNYLNNTLPKKLKEWKLKMEPDMQDKYTPEQVMDTIRSKTDKALQMRPEDMKLKKGDKKKVKKNKKK